jgi:HlyD family secretion protein
MGPVSTTMPTSRASSPVVTIRAWHIVLLLFLVAVVFLVLVNRDRDAVEVKVISPHREDISNTVSSVGMVTPINDYAARANFSGMVQDVFVSLGQKVSAGQELIYMKDQYALSRLRSAKVALEDAQVVEQNIETNGSLDDRIALNESLTHAQDEQFAATQAVNTLRALHQRGSVSDAELSAGEGRLHNASVALTTLQQRMSDRFSARDRKSWKDKVAANSAALEAEKISFRNAHIISTIAGTVYLLPVAKYDFVGVGMDMVHVADLTRTQVKAQFADYDIGKLHNGEPVLISWEGRRTQQWHGHVMVTPLAAVPSPGGSTGQCIVAIDDSKGDLPVNTSVTVTIVVDTHPNVVTIPREALQSEGGDHYVYRVVNDRIARTPVQVGIINALRAEITSGISPQDLLAVSAVDDHKLSDGLKIKVSK